MPTNRKNRSRRSIGLRETQPMGIDVPEFVTPNVLAVINSSDINSGYSGRDALVRTFSPVTEAWFHVDRVETLVAGIPLMLIISDEAYTDRAWYTIEDSPAWAPAFALYQQMSPRRPDGFNETVFYRNYNSYGVFSPGTSYDLYMNYLGRSTVSYAGHSHPVSEWYMEVWQDGVKTEDIVWQEYCQYNIFPPSGQYFESLSAIFMIPAYGTGTPEDIQQWLTNYAVGTSRGADDILAVEDFSSGDFGSFTYMPADNPNPSDPSHSFQVVPSP